MNLFVLRHGLAVERTLPAFKRDSDRPLTPQGRKKIVRLATLLRRLGVSFDLILTSPYVRARQTAGVVADILETPKALEISKHLAPGRSFSALLEELRGRQPAPDNVLLVGHEPDLSRFISLLVTGKRGLPLELKKGGLCKLEIAAFRPGPCATLQWLLPAKVYCELT